MAFIDGYTEDAADAPDGAWHAMIQEACEAAVREDIPGLRGRDATQLYCDYIDYLATGAEPEGGQP